MTFGFLLIESLSCGLAAAGQGGGPNPLWVAAAAACWWAIVAWVMAAGSQWLRTPEGKDLEYYGLPNGLTAVRAWSTFPFLLCAYLTFPGEVGFNLWLIVGFTAGILDFFDGFIARRLGPITDLGRALDPPADALFFSAAALSSTAPSIGVMPLWLAGLILLRYLGPLLLTPAVFVLGYRPELGHTIWGRRNTGLTGVVFAALVLTRLLTGPVSTIALVLGLPLLLPTMLLHFRALFFRLGVKTA